MKKNMEIMPAGESNEKKEKTNPVDLNPSKETVEAHEKAAKKMEKMSKEHIELEQKDQQVLEKQYGEEMLRYDFLGRAENFEKEFKGVKVEVGGEKYTLDFSSFSKDGKKVENVKDLKKEVDEKGLGLDHISGNFNLVASKGGPESLNLTYNLPVKRMLTCQTPAMLERLITESFAGTTDHYQKMKQQAPVAPKEKPKEAEKKQEKVNDVKKEAEKRGGEVSILEGQGMTSLVVRFPNEKQLHLTTSDMAVWSYTEVEKGKVSRSGSTSFPQEVLPNEEPDISE